MTTDADDLDEILQVPTKPGRRPKTRGSACPSAVDSQHDSRADATAAERDRRELVRQASAWIDSEDDRDEDEDNDDGVSEQGLHGRSVTLGPLGSSSVMVEGEGGFGSEDDGDGAKETEFLPKDPSASKGSSSPLCQEARNAAFIGIESSLVSPQNALTLDLDYCPSSHDDDSSSSSSSDEDAPTLPRNPPPLGPSPSSPIKATSPTSPLGSHAPPLSSVSPHASGAPSQHLTEHEDDPLAEHEAEAVTASTPQPGNCMMGHSLSTCAATCHLHLYLVPSGLLFSPICCMALCVLCIRHVVSSSSLVCRTYIYCHLFFMYLKQACITIDIVISSKMCIGMSQERLELQ